MTKFDIANINLGTAEKGLNFNLTGMVVGMVADKLLSNFFHKLTEAIV